MAISSIEEALEDFRVGKFLIVIDDESRENEGDLIIASEHITAEAINFMARYGRGLICTPLDPVYFERLQLPLMVPSEQNDSSYGTSFGISVNAKTGVTTGISAADRAHTVKVLTSAGTTRSDLAMPGHIFPLRARRGGVLERRGHTEAAVDLAKLAGLNPTGTICEVLKENGEMARLPDLEVFAAAHGIKIITIEDLANYLVKHRTILERVGETLIPTEYGDFQAVAFRDQDGREHLAMCYGEVQPENTLVRIHSECLTGDVFGSLRCDCGPQLELALKRIVENGSGLLLYLAQEGRGIGLGNKIRAYALQDQGLDTVEANRALGFLEDPRSYGLAATMLRDLGVGSASLLTNNPRKVTDLEAFGIKVVKRVPHETPKHDKNIHYLKTKVSKLGHFLSFDEVSKV